MKVRNADSKDFEKIMKIYKYAQDYMIQSGNPTQMGAFLSRCRTDSVGHSSERLQSNIRRKWDTWGMCTV